MFGSQVKGAAGKGRDVDIVLLFAGGFSPLERLEKKLEMVNEVEYFTGRETDTASLA